MTVLDATSVAALLREFGHRSALRGGNPFRAKAYARAADNLPALSLPLETIIAQDRLREIPGVGDAIADIIKKLHATGTHPALEKMRKEIPSGVLDMLTIPGLRADKVIKIYKELGITSLEGLEEATRKGQLQKVKGLGQALQTKIVNGLVMRREAHGKRHMHRAAELLKSAETHLKEMMPDIVRVTPTGDFRRGCELVGDLALVAELPNLPRGPKTIRAGGQLAAHLTDAAHYGISLLLATGSKAHLAGLREVAAKQNMTLEERGLCRGNTVIAAATEEEIYKALGMQPVPPELREGRDEIAHALTGELPELVADADIKGILHAHTDRSDGVDTLETMAEATLARGYRYFGVADHSQSAHYAGGLGADEVAEQQNEADRLNKKYGRSFRIFKGIESDILADGSLDFPDGVLDTFDFVVASVHGRFKLDRGTQTERIIRAVANPYTTILGHVTGRQLLRRPGYEIDVERVLSACAEYGVAVEINANPWRLDLDWRWHGTALRLGCRMSINPDAHSVREINLTHWGVEMARKGGVPKESVLNCLSQDEFAAYLEQRRAHRQGKVAPGRRPLRARATNAKKHIAPRSPSSSLKYPILEPTFRSRILRVSNLRSEPMPSEKNLQELFHDTLKDIYFAEKKILSTLPKMAKAAQSEDLKAAFQKHETETEEHVARLEKVFEEIDETPRGKTCDAIMGIIEEGQEIMKEFKGAPALDAGLLAAAQAVEHYEIARYGTLKTWAAELGLNQAVKLLAATLSEEKKTDEALTKLAESEVNQHAQAA